MAAAACWWPGAAVVPLLFLLVYLEALNLNMCVSVCVTPHKPAARLTLSLLCSAVQLLINLVG